MTVPHCGKSGDFVFSGDSSAGLILTEQVAPLSS